MEYIFAGKNTSQTHEKRGNKIVEKRFKPRVPTNILISQLNFLNRENQGGRIIDLSEHGAFLESQPAKLNSSVQMTFSLPQCIESIKVKGRVIRTAVTKSSHLKKSTFIDEEETTGLGIQFTSVSKKDRLALSEYLETTLGSPSNPSFTPKVFEVDPETKKKHQNLFSYNEIDSALDQAFKL